MRWMTVIAMAAGALACRVEPAAEDRVAEGSTGADEIEPGASLGATEGEETTSTTRAPEDEPTTDRFDEGETETDGDDGNAEPTCESVDCMTACNMPIEFEDDDGQACECNRAPHPEDYVRCDLGAPCGDDRLCIIQAVRYGVLGSYRVQQMIGEDFYTLDIDVLGEGRARAHEAIYSPDCCGGSQVNEAGRFFHPQAVIASDDIAWATCLREGAPEDFVEFPECLRPQNLFAGACEEPLAECPAVAEPGRSCRESCPMSSDGVCDEAGGTGLCEQGCDRVDCSCEADVREQCDAAYGSLACPLGADAEDCN